MLIIRGMNRDERDDDADTCDEPERCDELSGSVDGEVEMSCDGGVVAVLGRVEACTVDADPFERYECERAMGTADRCSGADDAASDELGTSAWPMSTDHRRRRDVGRSVWLICVGAECSDVRGLDGSSSGAVPNRMGSCG